MRTDRIEHLPRLPQRERTGHKGTYGTVLGIGGSRGMAGAAALAGKAALLTGCGLVRLAVPDPVLETAAGFYPELTTLPCPAGKKGRFALSALEVLLEYAEQATAVFLGPGLGRSAGLDILVPSFLRQNVKPLVVDADALNAVAVFGTEQMMKNIIFTPHPGEFARLIGSAPPPEEQLDERIAAAAEFAQRCRITLVLKGHRTIITDGKQTAVNSTGNPGMATGGSGDVLTGIITSLLAQGFTAFEAAQLGVFLHGAAGDAAAERYTEPCVTAAVILECIPAAVRQLTNI
ncbi:MAG: NAD(P)H-hydrate dehydratase [Planctomycetaceae bacterium]|jgi:NAD(P)H-hydrate epimerase|nr:NAD(P)H-hydrate dehydratase [Planctomycetaceae bacterium]